MHFLSKNINFLISARSVFENKINLPGKDLSIPCRAENGKKNDLVIFSLLSSPEPLPEP